MYAGPNCSTNADAVVKVREYVKKEWLLKDQRNNPVLNAFIPASFTAPGFFLINRVFAI
jgi:hypothetical protein